MNAREQMQALLDGKRLANGFDCYYELREGALYFVNEVSAEFNANKPRELYVEPNPHKPGTFEWAMVELERGATVISCIGDQYHPGGWGSALFTLTEIRSTTWRTVTP